MDLQRLKRLRSVFLSEESTQKHDYWESEELLSDYDQFFGEKISWKWRSVWRELIARNLFIRLLDSELHVVDWACGSGRASRSFLDALLESGLSSENLKSLCLLDRSKAAENFAKHQITQLMPSTTSLVKVGTKISSKSKNSRTLYLISHVVTELDSASEKALLGELKKSAHDIVWVESGSKLASHRLGSIRDQLIQECGYRALAPCTHSQSCPALNQKEMRHWCHFFSKIPNEVFHNGESLQNAEVLGVDLRAAPYSFFYLRKQSLPDIGAINLARGLGKPRIYKAYLKWLSCSQEKGLFEGRLQRRDAPEAFKLLKKNSTDQPYLWTNLDKDDIKP